MRTLCWAAVLTAVSCNWQPEARDVKPEQLVAGSARVVRLIDSEGRYALFTLGTGDALRWRILSSDTRQSCAFAATDTPVNDPLNAPNLKGDGIAKFWFPVFRRDPADSTAPDQLFYANEACTLIGPFGTAVAGPDMIALRDDKRNVSIVPGPDGALSLVDPWTKSVRMLAAHADGVDRFDPKHWQEAQVPASAPEAMWVVEDGKLTQRGLDGTLLLSLGGQVTGYAQNLLQGALRVAYTDGGNVYEAKGPAFTPVLIANDACDPSYTGTSLDVHTPCGEQQLVRVDLTSGAIKRFTQGVFTAYVQSDVNFELQRADDGNARVFVVSGTTRTELVPPPVDYISILDHQRIAGRTADATFGMWNTMSGFVPAFTNVSSMAAFRDSRTNRLLWLMQYKVDNGLGVLAGFDQSALERIVAGTPTEPTVLASQVLDGGYQVFLPSILPEPMVLSLQPPIAQQADMSSSGQLNALLLSGSLASRIDEGVSSSLVALAPYPGILYGILEGPRSGLWFAAL